MNTSQFMKAFLKEIWKKIINPKLLILCAIGGYIVFYYTSDSPSFFQTYRIHKFQKDFAELNKSFKEIKNESLTMIGNANSPIDCWYTTENIYIQWRKSQDELPESGVTHS